MIEESEVIMEQPRPSQISVAEKVSALKSMQVSTGWGIMLKVLIENKEYLERMILGGNDPETKEDFSQVEMNRMRDKRGLIEDLINTPNGLIDAIETAGLDEKVNFDPYHDDAVELSKDK